MTTLYKMQDGEVLVVTGHLSRQEVKELMKQGYRSKNPRVNKNGIPVSA